MSFPAETSAFAKPSACTSAKTAACLPRRPSRSTESFGRRTGPSRPGIFGGRSMLNMLAAILFVSQANAAFNVPGYELVYSYPVETTLNEPDLREASVVWPEMFDAAGK